MTDADALVLAGGRATRMGGVDKPAIEIGGRSMLDTALGAVAGCAHTVVVGPHRPGLADSVRQTREHPAGAGPVAAVAAGMRSLAQLGAAGEAVVILAADMPFLTAEAIDELVRRAEESDADAVFAADPAGRPQYLAGVWRRAALQTALDRLDTVLNQPMRALVPGDAALVPLPGVADCDTDDDVRRARTRATPLPLDEARQALRDTLSRLPQRDTPLSGARGAVLAAPLIAVEALPRFDVSAMDGYAVAGDGPWRIRPDVGFAGGARPTGLQPGEAVRIATGAHVPEGATTVVRDEHLLRGAHDLLHRSPDAPRRDDVRRRGEDWRSGDTVAPAGTAVGPALLSVAASAEIAAARVRGPVCARIIMTGDEIRAEGPLHDGQTRDALGPILPELLSWCGIDARDRIHLRDTANGFDEALAAPDDCDLLVVVGATGGGAADQLRTTLERTDARILVPRLRLRPGGSTVIAETRSGTTVLGLPGNPFAAVATLLALAPAIVDGRTGRTAARLGTGPLRNASDIAGATPRIVPARAVAEGGWLGDAQVRTAHLAGLVNRDGLVVVPADAPDDTVVEFLPLPG